MEYPWRKNSQRRKTDHTKMEAVTWGRFIWKKTYKIEVDCAACALKMEDAAKKVEGVTDATVSFMTQKMKVEFADGSDEKAIMENVVKACKKVEDDCEIYL